MLVRAFGGDDLTMPVPHAECALRVAWNRHNRKQTEGEHHRHCAIGNAGRFGDSGVSVHRSSAQCAV